MSTTRSRLTKNYFASLQNDNTLLHEGSAFNVSSNTVHFVESTRTATSKEFAGLSIAGTLSVSQGTISVDGNIFNMRISSAEEGANTSIEAYNLNGFVIQKASNVTLSEVSGGIDRKSVV